MDSTAKPGKMPWMKFFPVDYLHDTQTIPLDLQGFWMRLLCHMHLSVNRGYLVQPNGKPMSIEEISAVTGCTTERAEAYCQHLVDRGIASRTRGGTLYNRRMAREAHISSVRRESGKYGAAARYGYGETSGICHGKSDGKPLASCISSLEDKDLLGDGGVGEGDLLRQSLSKSAKRIIADYRAKVRCPHRVNGEDIEDAIMDVLQSGTTEQELLRYIDVYSDHCMSNGILPKYRQGGDSFFASGGWKDWKDPVAPPRPPAEPWADRVAEANRRMDAQAAKFR